MARQKKKKATKPSTSKGCKRLKTANQKASGSAKRIKYDPESLILENRDKRYCQNFNVKTTIKTTFSLKAIRVPDLSSEEEMELEAFVEEEVEFEGFDPVKELKRRPEVKHKTFILKARKAIIDEMNLSDPCESNPDVSVPTAAPFDMTCDVFEPYREEEAPIACEYPQNLMHVLPTLEEDSDDSDDDTVKFRIRKEGTRAGNPVIEDSHGHTYNYQRTGKSGYCNFQCIKRQKNGKNNCCATLRVDNFEGGDEEMKVRQTGRPHNHDSNYSNMIRKDINFQLKRQSTEYPRTKSSDIVYKVLSENSDFQNYYDSSGRLPKTKSMCRTIQRERRLNAAPIITSLDFEMDIKWIEVANFFHKEVKVKKARHFIFFTNAQLIYMNEAHAWYIDGTFKIVGKPMKQLLTIHVVVLYQKQRASIPVCFILMSR